MTINELEQLKKGTLKSQKKFSEGFTERMTELKPQRMWLDHADDIESKFGRHYYMCPRCNHNADYFIGGTENWWCAEAPNYCPNCGAAMADKGNTE